MSVKSQIIRKTFGGQNPFSGDCRIVTYAGIPDNLLELSATSPYGKGTLCLDTNNNVTYYKTDTDSTDWTLID